MFLGELLVALNKYQVYGNDRVSVSGLAYDSRLVGPGETFFCIRGLKRDGHAFAREAVARGASSLIVDCLLDIPGVPQVVVEDTREAMARISALFFGNPSRSLGLVGVTGTNGKTTTAHLVEAVFAGAGLKTGLVGTVFNKIGDEIEPSQRTTPESLDLQRLLRRMADAGAEWVSMEVSSHALDLHRVTACEFDLAVFTNITRDHFDFHSNFGNYLKAKARLFSDLGMSNYKQTIKTAIINADDPQAPFLANRTPSRVITYGIGPADVRAVDIEMLPLGSSFTVQGLGRTFRVALNLPGYFNVSNTLAAVAVGLSYRLSPEIITAALAQVSNIPGRYEVIDCGQNFTVIVDFAHNPDALANVLRIPTLIPSGRRIAVFGAEGGKDRGKRPIMGEVAMRQADYCIITSDNVYDEDPYEIAQQVASGAAAAGKPSAYEVIIDRRQAIARALEIARPGDLVVIAGKGHEIYQVFNAWKTPFDDRVVVRELLGKSSQSLPGG